MKTVIVAPDDYKKSGNPITASKYRYYWFRTLLRSGYFAVNSQQRIHSAWKKRFRFSRNFCASFQHEESRRRQKILLKQLIKNSQSAWIKLSAARLISSYESQKAINAVKILMSKK